MEAIISFLPIILVFVVFYLLILFPEKKRKKQYEAMLSDLKINDEVMTRGGVMGKIITLEDDSIILESGPDRIRLRFSKNAVSNKIYKEN